MDPEFSPRGTGACPICKKCNRCILQKNITEKLGPIQRQVEKKLELVIYVCPSFIETD